jgi:tetratricopeptide (TPR) repeat protein
MSEMSEPDAKQKQRAQAYFQTGTDAALKKNFDYATNMFREALKILPENLLFRQSLRGVQRLTFNNDPGKVSRLAGARSQPMRLSVRTAKARSKWLDVLETCEDIFKNNPWDIGASQDAAEAAEHLGHPILARWYLESVHEQGKTDANYLRHLARVYELNEDWERAIHCWEEVKRLAPNDEEALRKTRSLAASASIARSGLSEALHKKPESARPEEEKPDSNEIHAIKLTPEERLLKIIQEDPQRVGPYLELADLHRRLNKLDEAERVLSGALKLLPDDGVLLSSHAEVQIARLKRYIDVWNKKSKENPSDSDAAAKLAKGRQMLDEYEIKVLRRRIALHPEELNLRYQLGEQLFRVGKYDEAIGEFQQARSAPGMKIKALHQAGRCFEEKKLPKLAQRNYEEALGLADTSDVALFNDLHYRLGRVAEGLGDLKKAEDHYNEVAANDYNYLDIADRLRSLNQ